MNESLKPYRIIQFAKAPVVGSVKTRLAPLIGVQRACDLHCHLLEYSLKTLINSGLGNVELHTDDIDHPFIQSLSLQYRVHTRQQQGLDLGHRMHFAISNALTEPGCQAVVLVGSDCPVLSAAYIAQAIDQLTNGMDVVFGPALDGGYVLVAMRKTNAAIFEGIAWGSDQVLQQSLKVVKAQGLHVHCLAPLQDIDRPQDLDCLAQFGIEY